MKFISTDTGVIIPAHRILHIATTWEHTESGDKRWYKYLVTEDEDGRYEVSDIDLLDLADYLPLPTGSDIKILSTWYDNDGTIQPFTDHGYATHVVRCPMHEDWDGHYIGVGMSVANLWENVECSNIFIVYQQGECFYYRYFPESWAGSKDELIDSLTKRAKKRIEREKKKRAAK